jgi:hypothetical protein
MDELSGRLVANVGALQFLLGTLPVRMHSHATMSAAWAA